MIEKKEKSPFYRREDRHIIIDGVDLGEVKKEYEGPITCCKKCGNDMTGSRVKMNAGPMTVRCDRCKEIYIVTVTIK